MGYPEDYDRQAYFDKGKIIALIENVRKGLEESGVHSALWLIDANRFSLQIMHAEGVDLTKAMYNAYKRWDEITAISIFIEPAGRAQMLQFVLSEKWFMKEEGDENKTDRRHVEDDGDFAS